MTVEVWQGPGVWGLMGSHSGEGLLPARLGVGDLLVSTATNLPFGVRDVGDGLSFLEDF